LSRDRLAAWIINLDNQAGADMARPQRPLDPTTGPAAAFAAQLRELREQARNPKYTVMAKRSGRSQTALSEAAGGQKLPTWETTEAFVLACDGDPLEWLDRWEAAFREVNGVAAEEPPLTPAVEPDTGPSVTPVADTDPSHVSWMVRLQQRRTAALLGGALLLVLSVGGLAWARNGSSKPTPAEPRPSSGRERA
jgi:hypothetical protein